MEEVLQPPAGSLGLTPPASASSTSTTAQSAKAAGAASAAGTQQQLDSLVAEMKAVDAKWAAGKAGRASKHAGLECDGGCVRLAMHRRACRVHIHALLHQAPHSSSCPAGWTPLVLLFSFFPCSPPPRPPHPPPCSAALYLPPPLDHNANNQCK